MRKSLKQRGNLTFYVREKYKDIVSEFISLIAKDKRLKQLQAKGSEQLFSIALCQLMYEYNQKRKKELQTEKQIKSEDVEIEEENVPQETNEVEDEGN